ncbi:MAG: hypothetical protein JJE27_03955 [Thermoleophilia bacterium]|nr:hypothetical protein [Thermoleophilia bacterium]
MAGWLRRRRFPPPGGGRVVLHVGDAAYDDWPIVGDFAELTTAMAFCQQLRERGFAAEITSDWPLDAFGVGDIALRVHPEEDQFAARELVEFAQDDGDEADD